MCGIAGAVWFDPSRSVDDATLARMTGVLAHRGPDDSGQFRSDNIEHRPSGTIPGVALGHRRLSIIDVDGGHQPLANEDGTIWTIFNGEIYNYRDLRKRLEGAGHRFRTQSDTEILVHLYEDEGPQLVEHLNGMFAFALWDSVRGRLMLARDRLGKKPLVYRLEEDRMLFASELKSLLEVPEVGREVDPAALDAYLTYGYVPHPHTIFRGIRKLPPAHSAIYADRKLTTSCYWQPAWDHEVARPLDDYCEELRSLLTSAVELRMQSDVPLGAFLSGGVDSSIIVGLMQKQSARPIKTFSIGFGEADFDETHFARAVATQHGTDHHEFCVEPKAIEILPKLIWNFDEPFADSSAVPTYCVAELARQHVTVALTGDGGDELFAGYMRYRAVRLASAMGRVPRPLWRAAVSAPWQRLAAAGRQRSLLRQAYRFGEAMSQPVDRRYLTWLVTFDETRRAELYTNDFLAQLPDRDPAAFVLTAMARGGSRDPVTRASLADLVTYLPCDLLTKVDIASMAHGLECRQPLLDYRVVELAAQMPIGTKLHGGRGKHILRKAFADLLPRQVTRRGKMGFGVPVARWFRGPLREYAGEVLLADRTLARGYFRPLAVERLWNEHQANDFDHGARLWSLLVLELWHRTWVDGEDRGGAG